VARGRFSAVFFIQCLRAIDVRALRLHAARSSVRPNPSFLIFPEGGPRLFANSPAGFVYCFLPLIGKPH